MESIIVKLDISNISTIYLVFVAEQTGLSITWLKTGFLTSQPIYFKILCITGLIDEQQKVRTITALALAALAEAATPYGIESFDSVLKPLWKGIRQHRGKVRYLILPRLPM